jgi:hypothetical protein
MSLFTNPIRPAPIASDAAVRRYVDAIRRQIEPDLLFLRRLRGQVVNRFVAQKRGVDLAGVRRPSRMGSLGRACLYASFALAVSVTGAMASSDAAAPGDFLYPLKRSIESMRLAVLPERFHDELAVFALTERIAELSQIVEAGDLSRATAFAVTVRDAYEHVVAESDDPAKLAERIELQVAWLDEVVSSLPESARAPLENAMGGVPGLVLDAQERGDSGTGANPASPASQGRGPGENRGSGEGGRAAGSVAADDDESIDATPTPTPEPTPEPDPTPKPKPEPTPREEPSAPPVPSPKASGIPQHAPAAP